MRKESTLISNRWKMIQDKKERKEQLGCVLFGVLFIVLLFCACLLCFVVEAGELQPYQQNIGRFQYVAYINLIPAVFDTTTGRLYIYNVKYKSVTILDIPAILNKQIEEANK